MWIGAGVIILPGVRIGHRSVVGAGCVVAKDVPAEHIVMGNPMRISRKVPEKTATADGERGEAGENHFHLVRDQVSEEAELRA